MERQKTWTCQHSIEEEQSQRTDFLPVMEDGEVSEKE
jgi:hypothetical protein